MGKTRKPSLPYESNVSGGSFELNVYSDPQRGGVVPGWRARGSGLTADKGAGLVDRRELLRFAGLMGLGAFSISLTPEALAAEKSRLAANPRRAPLVVIDPGHGGVDPGCIGYSGTYEKDITISTAREIG